MTQIESMESATNIIAVFGTATLVKAPNGKLELQGGDNADFIEARDWASMFMPEVIVCPSGRSPLSQEEKSCRSGPLQAKNHTVARVRNTRKTHF